MYERASLVAQMIKSPPANFAGDAHTYIYVWEGKVVIILYKPMQHIFLACCKWNII